jgi:Tol biopolymer transport system component
MERADTKTGLIPAAGGMHQMLEIGSSVDHQTMDHHPVWSSNGLNIAFTSKRSGDLDIWVKGLNID